MADLEAEQADLERRAGGEKKWRRAYEQGGRQGTLLQTEARWCWTGAETMQFIPVFEVFFFIMRVRKLDGIAIVILARAVMQWRHDEQTTCFPIDLIAMARAMGLEENTIRLNLKAIAEANALNVGDARTSAGEGLSQNRPLKPHHLFLDLQPLRALHVDGGVPRIEGRVDKLGGYDLWTKGVALTEPRPPWSAVPESLLELMITGVFKRPATWAVLFAVAFCHGLPHARPITSDAVRSLLGMPRSTARREVRLLAAAGVIHPDGGDCNCKVTRPTKGAPAKKHRPCVTYHVGHELFEKLPYPERLREIVKRNLKASRQNAAAKTR